jgi:biopolymer transport protein ExbD
MAYGKKTGTGESPKLNMTAMIDVVFLLLIFFVVVVKQEDILSTLSANRPTTDGKPGIETTTIIVDTQSFTFNGKPMNRDELDSQLGRIAMFSKTAGVVIKCTRDSPHGMLVQALDLCSKYELTNIALFSM